MLNLVQNKKMNLTKHLTKTTFADILPTAILRGKLFVFQLSAPSDFSNIDPTNTDAMIQRTAELMNSNKAILGVGRYAEIRELYQHPQYGNRCIHLGLDLTAPAGTPVYAPLSGKIHSFANNAAAGDYGPTIILEHNIDNFVFYTLYGHLSLSSISNIKVNGTVEEKSIVGHIGEQYCNGGWPPHLHFQIIQDIKNQKGDYPGVCSLENQAEMLANCPNPNLIVKLPL